MPIKNYTTKISALKSVAQIQSILASSGARRVMIEYAERRPVAVAFEIQVAEHRIPVILSANVEGCLHSLERDGVARIYRTMEHAERVAWRLVLNWIEVQLAFVEAGQSTMAQLFLGYAMTSDRKPLAEVLITGEGQRLLAEHLG